MSGAWARLALVLLLADLGLAVVGTLVAAIAVQTRARDLITSMLALPLLIPVIIGAARATAPIFAAAGAGALAGTLAGGPRAVRSVFALLAWALFDYLVED